MSRSPHTTNIPLTSHTHHHTPQTYTHAHTYIYTHITQPQHTHNTRTANTAHSHATPPPQRPQTTHPPTTPYNIHGSHHTCIQYTNYIPNTYTLNKYINYSSEQGIIEQETFSASTRAVVGRSCEKGKSSTSAWSLLRSAAQSTRIIPAIWYKNDQGNNKHKCN